MTVATVTAEQRYNPARPCPVCSGHDRDPRGHGRRCFGYVSADGRFARCTREEWAGRLRVEDESGAYVHLLRGDCGCGQSHGLDASRPVTRDQDLAARAPIVARYQYRDEQGRELFEVVRRADKSFAQRRRTTAGYEWGLGDVRRVLYRLPELLASSNSVVFVAEGEKDVGTLEALGLVATCNPGGAGKWKPDYSVHLRGRDVIVLPDNDDVGRRHAEQVAASLSKHATRIKVLPLPGLPDHGDVTDWVAAGGTKEALLRLADGAPKWKPALAAQPVDVTISPPTLSKPSPAGDSWPEPQEITDQLLPVPAFDSKLLPDPIAAWVMDAADRTQCPPEYSAAGALVALGSVVGRAVAIRPKQHDDWVVVPNLWGAVVGRPGTLKSPALSEALRHVRHLEATAHEAYERERADWELSTEIADGKKKAILKKAAAASADIDGIKREALGVALPPEPKERRFVLNDSTVEKLGEILAGNPRGTLVVRDELTGWLGSLDREGHEADRAFYLESWNGTGGFSYDRIGRGTVRIPAACVSLLGGIQPGPLARYFRGALRNGSGADGLVQRFQVLVFPDAAAGWKIVDRWPDSAARRAAFEVFDRLANGDLVATAGAAQEDQAGIPFLRFAPDAQTLFSEWYADLMARARKSEHEAFEAHLVKYAKLMPALALISHLAETPGGGPVTIRATKRAAALCDLLEAHARRVYDAAASPDTAAARLVVARLKAGALPTPFTARDLYRKQWANVTTPSDAEATLDVLEQRGWVRRVEHPPGPLGGHPRVEYHINPAVTAGRKVAA